MALMCQDGFEMNYKLSYKHIFYAVGRIMSSHISLDFNLCLFSILLTPKHDGMLKSFITCSCFFLTMKNVCYIMCLNVSKCLQSAEQECRRESFLNEQLQTMVA